MRCFGKTLSILFGAVLAPAAVLAETGVDFRNMPVGCKWHVEYSSGEHWVSEFVGKKGSKYLVKTSEAGNPGAFVRNTEYAANGFMTRRIWANGKWEAFKPFSCFEVEGTCRYVFSNADGAKQSIDSVVVKKGDSYVSKAKPSDGAAYPDERFKLGPFQVMIMSKSSRYWTKVTKFEGCGTVGS